MGSAQDSQRTVSAGVSRAAMRERAFASRELRAEGSVWRKVWPVVAMESSRSDTETEVDIFNFLLSR